MSTIEFTDKELTYLLLALKKYEAQLLSFDDEDMEDRTTDLVFVQSLQQKVKDSKSGK
ncbi:hypothetical protein J7I44_09525 [Frateuria sp. MAH-13]|uniref:Uncharacterized protein n=1 Tax=Frateuria flava TaxID=2821489 RepID=A0ABS4DNA1_9GAMM|nr:hypothetical protein [Frateuria flava]MBP1474543.1 hypothetical protein [Frateuria flava]